MDGRNSEEEIENLLNGNYWEMEEIKILTSTKLL